jgi:uncharacterized RDD family membrane protein YckC
MTEAPGYASAAPTANYASWISRVGAYIIDVLPTVIVAAVLTALFGDNETTSSSASFQLNGWPALLLFVLSLGWIAFNWGHLQGTTGQTIGKKVVGIAVHGADGRPLGFGLSFARYFVHILDSLPCCAGYLWPLWDKENRTFADMVMSTRVVKV